MILCYFFLAFSNTHSITYGEKKIWLWYILLKTKAIEKYIVQKSMVENLRQKIAHQTLKKYILS